MWSAPLTKHDQGAVEIAVYNRAILLLTTDDEAGRRIHQMCCPAGHARMTRDGRRVDDDQ